MSVANSEQHDVSVPAGGWRIPRAVAVWGAFLVAGVVAIVALRSAAPARSQLGTLRPTAERGLGAHALPAAGTAMRVEPRDAPMARDRWKAIVIHDSGAPAGDMASLERRHLDAGLAGLGYHFVIGNGQGIDDGHVVAGLRWDRQLPGAHAVPGWCTPRPVRAVGRCLDAPTLNSSAIAICVVGNFRRRPCTERQAEELGALVRALQAELGIGADAVFFAPELARSGTDGGGWTLPSDQVRARLLP